MILLLREHTLWIKRIEHRKWTRGLNGLHQLGQPVSPSVLFPVFNPPYPQGTLLYCNCHLKRVKMEKFNCRSTQPKKPLSRRRRRYCTAFVICPSLVNLSTDKKGWAHASFLAATSARPAFRQPLSTPVTRQETREITRVTVTHSADAKCAHGGMRIYTVGETFRSMRECLILGKGRFVNQQKVEQ